MPFECVTRFITRIKEIPAKVYIVIIHDGESRPWINGVYGKQEDAKEACKRYNETCKGNEHADFYPEKVR